MTLTKTDRSVLIFVLGLFLVMFGLMVDSVYNSTLHDFTAFFAIIIGGSVAVSQLFKLLKGKNNKKHYKGGQK